ncbi:MAG: hypothetical protein ACYC91_18380 [Solirubrobacteraceae bacterium]
MTSTIATAVIAGTSAIGGGVIVAGSNYVISRAQASDARQGGLRQALVALLSTLNQLDHQLRTEPRPKRTVRVVNEQMATRFPQIDYLSGRIHRRLFQPHLDALVTSFHQAMAATLLAAPPDLLRPLDVLNAVMMKINVDSDEWWGDYEAARADFVVACRRVLGYHPLSASAGS